MLTLRQTITRRIPSPRLVRIFFALKFRPYNLTSLVNGTDSTGSTGSKKNEAIVGTVPEMDALVIVAMAAIFNAMAVTL